MKLSVIYFFLLYSNISFSQTNSKQIIKDNRPSTNWTWELKQYVWSHSHSLRKEEDKPLLDFEAMDKWICLSNDNDFVISPNGKYVAYGIQRGVDHLAMKLDSIVVQAVDYTWRMAFQGGKSGFFSSDNKYYCFISMQGLCILQIGSQSQKYIQNVVSYKLPLGNRHSWLAYHLKSNELVLKNLITGKDKSFQNVSSYEFDQTGQWLIYRTNSEVGSLCMYNIVSKQEIYFNGVNYYQFDRSGKSLVLNVIKKINNKTLNEIIFVRLSEQLDLGRELGTTIWSTSDTTKSISNCTIEVLGKQILFMVTNDDKANIPGQKPNFVNLESNIWYWREGMDSAEIKLKQRNIDSVGLGMYIDGEVSFTDNGNYFLFLLQPYTPLQSKRKLVHLDIWDYKDTSLQSSQLFSLEKPKKYWAICNIKTGKVVRVLKEWEKVKAIRGNFAVVGQCGQEKYKDMYWEKNYNIDSNWLVSLLDGSRRLLPTRGQYSDFWFSPGGNYLVFFDAEKEGHYFSFNLHTGLLANISKNIPAWELGSQNYSYYASHRSWEQPVKPVDGGLAGWLDKEKGMLVYSAYDIWMLDISGKKAAVNITHGNGQSQKIIFGLMDKQRYESNDAVLPKQLILKAFNTMNKENGYYRAYLNYPYRLELLNMEACYMQKMEGAGHSDPGMQPLKATDTDIWIVRRQTATEPSNYYITLDFKSYRPLTELQPQKAFNWYTKEFHHFKEMNGITNQGLLYKPENFDPNKKYPVIIIFYNQFTDNLNQFPNPEYNECAMSFGISPSWLVSHGYLVFTPDVYVAPLQYGPTALNTIESAVHYLKQLPFVDSQRIGGCSHSWSAKLGSYIFTHSTSFAATAISEGFAFANPVNIALSLDDVPGNNLSLLNELEIGFEYGNLWEHKESWLDQTAVLNVDKATSPLLLFCGKNNQNSRINQTLQLFIALRRLGKKAWWLQYEEGGHWVQAFEARDFTIRFTQFFDHYLKGAPPARWMTEGKPAALKEIEDRYELDPEGSCGKNCKICEANKAFKE